MQAQQQAIARHAAWNRNTLEMVDWHVAGLETNLLHDTSTSCRHTVTIKRQWGEVCRGCCMSLLH